MNRGLKEVKEPAHGLSGEGTFLMERLVSAKSPRQGCAWHIGVTAGRSVCQQCPWAAGGGQGRDEARKESETKSHF